jgi:formimidoylglutamate deiminase
MKTNFHFRAALLPDGWHDDVRLCVGDGVIEAVATNVPPTAGDGSHEVAVPGMPNLHSHAFQRAMAGRTETRGTAEDSFWTWREAMYRIALSMTPDDVEAIARQAYVEMLETGFTRVGEFHYLHHDADGRPYRAPAEMAERICAAASAAGIGLTLLPVFYAHGQFGGRAPGAEQRRFVSSLDGYERLFADTRQAAAAVPGSVIGVAPHSLRAVEPTELAHVAAMANSGPIHIHIAEQYREVRDCLAWSGARPVAWLLDHAPVDECWCLVHATHMENAETFGVAHRGAVIGLCPVTESNLGDGIFGGALFLSAGGRLGIGSDSNVEISVASELRQLEYTQRLARQTRNVMAVPGQSTGRSLFQQAISGGAQALGLTSSGLSVGASADFVTLCGHSAFASHGDGWLDSWIFAAGNRLVDCVFVRGERLVEAGCHRDREATARDFRAVVDRLTVG